jgi:hypothetical protein
MRARAWTISPAGESEAELRTYPPVERRPPARLRRLLPGLEALRVGRDTGEDLAGRLAVRLEGVARDLAPRGQRSDGEALQRLADVLPAERLMTLLVPEGGVEDVAEHRRRAPAAQVGDEPHRERFVDGQHGDGGGERAVRGRHLGERGRLLDLDRLGEHGRRAQGGDQLGAQRHVADLVADQIDDPRVDVQGIARRPGRRRGSGS